jgi:hypothetical protein
MRLFHEPKERTPQQFSMNQGRAPLDGPQSALAGVAEPGDRLDVLGYGSYVNRGSKASPRWVRLYDVDTGESAPASSSGNWKPLDGQ